MEKTLDHAGIHRNMETVFQLENFRIFADDFRPVPGGKHRKVIGMHRKIFGKDGDE